MRVADQHHTDIEAPKEVQQPSLIHGSFMQIMVNPLQLQDHEFTAWLDRLVDLGIGWSGVLTQEFKDEKGKTKSHPICYVSG